MDDDFQTVLHLACKYSFNTLPIEIIKLLLQKGFDPYAKDYLGKTPFDYLSKNKLLDQNPELEDLKYFFEKYYNKI